MPKTAKHLLPLIAALVAGACQNPVAPSGPSTAVRTTSTIHADVDPATCINGYNASQGICN